MLAWFVALQAVRGLSVMETQATNLINAETGMKLTRAVVITEEEHDNDYITQEDDKIVALPAVWLVRFSGVGLLLKMLHRLFNDFIRFCFHIGGVFAWQVFALNIETAYAEAERRRPITAVPHFRT